MANKQESPFRINGRVIDQQTRQGISGLRVEAWDKDLIFSDFVGGAATDDNGVFQIVFDQSYFAEIFLDRRPDLFFKVFRGDALIKSTEDAVLWNVSNATTAIEIEVDSSDKRDPIEPAFRVFGTVHDASGKPMPHLSVRAFVRRLRTPELLGGEETNAKGEFRIEFRLAAVRPGDALSRRAPWLIVEVRETPDGNVLAKQEVQKAARDQNISFTLSNVGALSEWQRIGEAVGPLLKRADLAPSDITPADVDFIVAETGVDAAALRAWIASGRATYDAMQLLARDHATDAEVIDEIGWPLFYTYARTGQGGLASVLQGSPARWESALRSGEVSRRIQKLDDRERPALIAALTSLQKLSAETAMVKSVESMLRQLGLSADALPRDVALAAFGIFQQHGFGDADAFLVLVEKYPKEADKVRALVRAVRLHALADGNLELMAAFSEHGDAGGDSFGPLAALSTASWRELLKKTGAGSTDVYGMQNKVERTYPLIALTARLDAGGIEFVAPELKDLKKHVDKYGAVVEALLLGKSFDEPGEAELPGKVRDTIKHLGGYSRAGLTLEVAADLINADVGSPAIAVSYGREVVRHVVGDKNAAGHVDQFFTFADVAISASAGFISGTISARYVPWIYGNFVGQPPVAPEVLDNLPTLRGLFGDLDECICKPCESVLGLPAYFVELLNQLKKVPAVRRPGEGVATALDRLRERRPDVFDLELSCDNSETELPHIDLALEALENAVAFPFEMPGFSLTDWNLWLSTPRALGAPLFADRMVVAVLQTTVRASLPNLIIIALGSTRWEVRDSVRRWTVEARDQRLWVTSLSFARSTAIDLLELPENRNARAYALLRAARFPWSLPLDIAHTETQLLLGKLGVSRGELLPATGGGAAQALAAETLGIALAQSGDDADVKSEWQLLAEARSGADLWLSWGVSAPASVTLTDPSSGEALIAPAAEVFARASILLAYTGLELDELEQLLSTRFVGGLTLSKRDQCKTSLMRLVSAAGAALSAQEQERALDRIHRLVRLSRKLPEWSLPLLDSAVLASNAAGASAIELNADVLARLASLVRLQGAIPLSQEQAVALLLPLDRVLLPPLKAGGSPLKLIDRVAPSGVFSSTALASFRREALATALGVSVEQLSAMFALIGQADPLVDERPATGTIDVLETVLAAAQSIADSGVSIEQTADLLGRAPPQNAGAIAANATTDLRTIQATLRSIVEVVPDRPLEQQTHSALVTFMEPANAAQILGVIADAASGETPASATTQAAIVSLAGAPGTERSLGAMWPVFDPTEAAQWLRVDIALTARQRFEEILRRVALFRRERALLDALLSMTDLTEPTLKALLDAGLILDTGANGVTGTTATAAMLDAGFWSGTQTPAVSAQLQPQLHDWIDRLQRVAVLMRPVARDPAMLELLAGISIPAASGNGFARGVDWRDLLSPRVSALGATWLPRWRAWRRIAELLRLSAPERISAPTLLAFFRRLPASAAVTANAFEPLAARFDLTSAATWALVESVAPAAAGDDLRDPVVLRRALERVLLQRQIGATSSQLTIIANLADNVDAAETAREVLRAKTDVAAWLALRRSISGKLRSLQRDALVAYLVHRNGWRDANDVYERYLIDPQMAPCTRTTRMLQAIAAVQLFAQRILFGLESEISASPQFQQRWAWMRNYRVWESNRKVFLYPENWLFPELRDDKSSSFKQLEASLGQAELTQSVAKLAFGQFLDDVAQLGQIQVQGLFEDVERAAGTQLRRDLYVVGRTPSEPFAYYWRRCTEFGSATMEWSAWQRIELDIQTDHVLPFMMNGQFHIAWPQIKRPATGAADPSTEVWQVRLCWAAYDGRAWGRHRTSREHQPIELGAFEDERIGLAFRCVPDLADGSVEISMYQEKGNPLATRAPDAEPGVPSDPNEIPDSSILDSSPAALIALIQTGWEHLPEDYRHLLEVWSTREKRIAMRPVPDEFYRVLSVFTHGKSTFNFDSWTAHNAHIDVAFGIPRSEVATLDQQYADLERFVWDLYRSTQSLHTADGKMAWPEFVNAVQSVTAIRKLTCRAWLKLRYKAGTTSEHEDFMELTAPGNRFSANIGGRWLTLSPTSLDEFMKLGPIDGEPVVTASYGVDFDTGRIFTTSRPAEAVAAGKTQSQTLHFIFNDPTRFSAAELGFDLDEAATFSRQCIFRIDADDTLSIEDDADHQPLRDLIPSSRPLMNGYEELAKHADGALLLPQPSGAMTTVFQQTSAEQFRITSAGSHRQSGNSAVWYFSENGVRSYLDLDASAMTNGLPILPDTYSSAALRKRTWAGASATWIDQVSQFESFGSDLLPIPYAGAQTTDFALAKTGALAFDNRMPYALYNWEVFFHAPLLIADQHSKQHNFEDAEHWLRFVFDPTNGKAGTDSRRFLRFRVFQELDVRNSATRQLTALAQSMVGQATAADRREIQGLIERWRREPFRPFVIARRRQMAFLWRTLFSYLDNLLAWADSLFRRDTRESISDATMLYVLAARILGPRPRVSNAASKRVPTTYGQVSAAWDDFANLWISAAGEAPSTKAKRQVTSVEPTDTRRLESEDEHIGTPQGSLYFCIPFNDKLLTYWDTVDQRLFDIRHCRNIEGISRDLPLTDSPIDPEILVRATAAGISLEDVVGELYAPPPNYRFAVLAARASELAAETRAFGGALLAAVEKKDAEGLGLLRSHNEVELSKRVQETRRLQIDEAERNLAVLRATRRSAETRYEQYQRLLGTKDFVVPKEQQSVGELSMLGRAAQSSSSEDSRLGLLDQESKHIDYLRISQEWTVAAGITKGVAGVVHTASSIAAAVDPKAGEFVKAIGTGLATTADMFQLIAGGWQYGAASQSTLSGHLRRRDEWAFQSNQVLKDLQQIDKQILAGEIRVQIARKELDNHVQQLEQTQAVDEYMRTKYSNVELYQWMVSQLSALHTTAYRLAYDMARRAERAAARELGLRDLRVIRTDSWNTPRSGLLAGERLHQDIKRLEIAFLDQNRREFELVKHVSLRRLEPRQLVDLKTTGSCEFEVPEWLFDLETPGHYMRRVKSVSVSVPCVTGPYVSVNCKLTMLRNDLRISTSLAGGYAATDADLDAGQRIWRRYGATESIVTSNGHDDSGLFETQLRDERFLPFESAGAVSQWRLEIPREFPQFDHDTISDVILHLRYTARDGGESLRDSALASLRPPRFVAAPVSVLLSCRSDFAAEWSRATAPGASSLRVTLARSMLPYWMEVAGLSLREILRCDLPITATDEAPEFVAHASAAFGQVDLGAVDAASTSDRLLMLQMG